MLPKFHGSLGPLGGAIEKCIIEGIKMVLVDDLQDIRVCLKGDLGRKSFPLLLPEHKVAVCSTTCPPPLLSSMPTRGLKQWSSQIRGPNHSAVEQNQFSSSFSRVVMDR